MRNRRRSWILVTCLIATSGCGNKTEHNAPTDAAIRFGRPSVAHVVDHARPEALAAFEHAKRFISEGDVDTSELDLMNPVVSHWCPPLPVYYDWLVHFLRKHPTSWKDKVFPVAVLDDGTCWVWQPPNPTESQP